MLSNKNRIQQAIQNTIHEQKPDFSTLFSDVTFERVPNAAPDGYNGYAVYAAQSGNTTMLAWNNNGNWKVQNLNW